MTAELFTLLLLALVAGLSVARAMPWLIGWLKRGALIDLPNERSSHAVPTPRGGGLLVVASLLVFGAAWVTFRNDSAGGALLGATALLALIFWFDDRLRGLPIALRLGAQALAVLLGLWMLPAEARLLGAWLPLWLERAIAFLAWLWFVNLYNFMDGIDGITGVETASIGLGLFGLSLFSGGALPDGLALITAAASLGFLAWNWRPAKVFLGDVGSVPLGYLLGGLLIQAAYRGPLGEGHWAAALLLPLYYCVDATATLLRRLVNGEKVWRAHRGHFYQRAARGFGDHAAVVRRIAGLNLALILLALLAVRLGGALWAGILLLAGLLLTVLLCRAFARIGGQSAAPAIPPAGQSG